MADADACDIGDEIARHGGLQANRGRTIADQLPITSAPATVVKLARCSRPMHLGTMTPDVTLLAALIAGVVSFLSPCVLPLVPPYLVYLAGNSLERLSDDDPATGTMGDTLLAALLFVAGFSTVFVALGASASVIGGLIRLYSAELSIAAGIVIIVMGLHFLGLFRIGWLLREKRAEIVRPVGLWGAYVMGLAFAFGWTPCIGPILAAILAVAASEQTVAKGAGL